MIGNVIVLPAAVPPAVDVVDRTAMSVTITAREGDHVLPALGERSYRIRRLQLRAGAGLDAARIAPKLATDGATRSVAMADADGPLSAVVEAGQPPVMLVPTAGNLIGSFDDGYGLRVPMFSLGDVQGAGELQIALDLEAVDPLLPDFSAATPLAALDLTGGAVGGDATVWTGVDVSAQLTPGNDALLGVRPVARCESAASGPQGTALLELEPPTPTNDLWIYAAFRPWTGSPGSATTVVNLSTAARDYTQRIATLGVQENFEQIVSGTDLLTTAQYDNFSSLATLDPVWDKTRTPSGVDFIPVLIHYAPGIWDVWVKDLTGAPTFSRPGHAMTEPVAWAGIGIGRPNTNDARVYDVVAAALYATDPRSA